MDQSYHYIWVISDHIEQDLPRHLGDIILLQILL